MSSGPASSPPAEGAPGTEEGGPGAPDGPHAPADPGRCPVCDAPSPGAYCPTCGQRIGAGRLTFREWLADFLDDNLSLNGTLPRSLGLLLTRPGFLTREWLAGRRSPYTRPFRLYLLASVVFFAVALTVDVGAGGAVSVQLGERSSDAFFWELWGRWLPTSMFFLVPVFAFLLKLSFPRSGLYYIEHLILALHLHAAAFLILIPTWLLELLPEPWLSILQAPLLLWILLYTMLAFRRVYGAGWLRVAVHGVLVPFVYLLGMIIATSAGTFGGLWLTEERSLGNAHDLYFEYMDSLEAGADSAVVRGRLEDALRGYQGVEPRVFDAHDHYHVGRLELDLGWEMDALGSTGSALREDSTALLPLGLAARAAWELGAREEAHRYAGRFLSALEATLNEEGGLSGRHVSEILQYRELARRIVAGVAGGAGRADDAESRGEGGGERPMPPPG